jgi:hypothetical protein
MTDQNNDRPAVSPLRQRMIEDMTIRGHQARLYPPGAGVCGLPRPLAGPGGPPNSGQSVVRRVRLS